MLSIDDLPGSSVVRDRIGGTIRSLLSGGPGSRPAEPDLSLVSEPAGDPGLFGPDSVAWLVAQDAAMIIGGVRSLLLQTMHPLAMAGVAEHSDYRNDPWGRLQRTAGYVGITTYGSTEAAHRTIAMVKAVHKRVRGTAPDGRRYSAQDPELLTWVHTTEVDSFLTAVREYGTTDLTAEQCDQYVAEMAELGRLMGGTNVPESVAEIEAYYRRVRPELAGTKQARAAVRFLMWPPVPLTVRPAYGLIASAAVATLPRFVREELWLPHTPTLDKRITKPAGKLIADVLGWSLGESPVAAAAHARVAAADL